jgi:hypothetical protein
MAGSPVVDPPAISDTGPSLAHIRAAAQCIVEPHWLTSPLTLADQQVGISEPGAAPSESQRRSGRRHPGGDSKRERSGLAIRSVASDE